MWKVQLCGDHTLWAAMRCRKDFYPMIDGGHMAKLTCILCYCIQLWGWWLHVAEGKEMWRTTSLWNWFQFTNSSFLPRSVELPVAFIMGILIDMLFNCIKGCFWYFLPDKTWPFEKMKIAEMFKITSWLNLVNLLWVSLLELRGWTDDLQVYLPISTTLWFMKRSMQLQCGYCLHLCMASKWAAENLLGKITKILVETTTFDINSLWKRHHHHHQNK